MKVSDLVGELRSNREGAWITPIMWYGFIASASMLALGLEFWLKFGPEVRAFLTLTCSGALAGMGVQARQWNISSDGDKAPMAPTEPPAAPVLGEGKGE